MRKLTYKDAFMGSPWRSAPAALMFLALLGASATAQELAENASAIAVVVPQQMRYEGKLPNRAGDTVEAVFRVYAAPAGGEPLWTETQRVAVSSDGGFSILLGSASVRGLPQSVFAGGGGRWLGMSVEQAPELLRVPLASVPYAMKAADAETLGGVPAGQFVTRTELENASPVTGPGGNPPRLAPDATPSGGGTANTVPLWTDASTLGNSAITQTGVRPSIGINTATPAATLDVNGSGIVRGNLNLPPPSAATASVPVNSPWLEIGASSFNSSTSLPATNSYIWQAVGLGNNTPSPFANLVLFYSAAGANPVSTGFSINNKGLINFASGQTFPGTLASITARTGLSSSGSNGVINLAIDPTVVATLSGNNTFTKPITFAAGQIFPGAGNSAISSITPASPLTGGGNHGALSLGLNNSALVSAIAPAMATAIAPTLETTYNGVYAQLGATNTFTSPQIIEGSTVISAAVAEGSGLEVTNSGDAFSTAIVASNGGKYGVGLSVSASTNGYGIEGFGTQTSGSIGVLGALSNSNGFSNSYFLLESDDGLDAGVWADGANGQESALIATADDLSAGIFFNDSQISPTIDVLNNYSGGPTGNAARGIGTVLRAGGPGGTCGINQNGDVSCTGQVKALVATKDGTRQVETYAVQSAENWIEDYGSGQLSHGSATVILEPAFAQTVNTGVEFHVFLTPGDDCKGLYVTRKTATSFEVHELGGGTASIPFDYKIVAKRRGLEAQRLIDVTERMQAENQAVKFKPLDHPLPRTVLHPGAHSVPRPLPRPGAAVPGVASNERTPGEKR